MTKLFVEYLVDMCCFL